MKTKINSILAGIMFCLIFCSAAVAVPNLISYQGVLNDQNGQPMSTTVNMTFRIYDVATGGTALWNETQNVPVSNGLFNVKLGSVQQLSPEIFQQDNIYLGIQVGADPEMAPRQQMTSASFAYKSEIAEQSKVPVGGIVAWVNNSKGVTSGTITTNSSNIIVDNTNDFISKAVKKENLISNIRILASLASISTNTNDNWVEIKEIIFSNSENDGYLVEDVDFSAKGTCDFQFIFFCSDGSSSSSSVMESHTNHSWNSFKIENPPYKKIWKVTVNARSTTYGEIDNIVFNVLDQTKVEEVISATQLRIEDNFFKASLNLQYKVYSTFALQENWMECNGQTVTDEESPLYDSNLPNLNGANKVLRGDIRAGRAYYINDGDRAGRIDTYSVVWIMRIK